MKRVHKIILLFVAIFLLGIVTLIGYLNYSIDKQESIRSVNNEQFTVSEEV